MRLCAAAVRRPGAFWSESLERCRSAKRQDREEGSDSGEVEAERERGRPEQPTNAAAPGALFGVVSGFAEEGARRPCRRVTKADETIPELWTSVQGQTLMDFLADPRKQREQRLDVRLRRAEVDDAGAEGEAAVDHRIGEERLAAALDARQQLLIQPLQVRSVSVRACRQLQVAPGRSGTS